MRGGVADFQVFCSFPSCRSESDLARLQSLAWRDDGGSGGSDGLDDGEGTLMGGGGCELK